MYLLQKYSFDCISPSDFHQSITLSFLECLKCFQKWLIRNDIHDVSNIRIKCVTNFYKHFDINIFIFSELGHSWWAYTCCGYKILFFIFLSISSLNSLLYETPIEVPTFWVIPKYIKYYNTIASNSQQNMRELKFLIWKFITDECK